MWGMAFSKMTYITLFLQTIWWVMPYFSNKPLINTTKCSGIGKIKIYYTHTKDILGIFTHKLDTLTTLSIFYNKSEKYTKC